MSTDNWAWIFMAGMFLYVSIRAINLSITHDEAITVLYHAQQPLLKILTFNGILQTNNHLLNTVLVKILSSIFGFQELAVRIPALAGYAIYLSGTYLILKKYLPRKFLLIGTILLNINPFLLDFFSLSRGYGLSVGLMVLGIYFLIKYISGEDRMKYAYLAFLLVALGALANLTVMFVVASLAFIYVFFEVYRFVKPGSQDNNASIWKGFIIKMMPLLAASAVLAISLSSYISKLFFRKSEISGMGSTSFWNGTIRSLLEASIYGKPYAGFPVLSSLQAFIIFSFLAYLAILSYKILNRRQKSPVFGLSEFFASIMALVTIMAFLLHYIFGINMGVERWVIFLIPIYLFFILFVWNDAVTYFPMKLRIPANAVLSAFFILSIAHFINTANFKYTFDWRFDADVKSLIRSIDHGRNFFGVSEGTVSIGNDWLLEPSLNFYRNKYGLSWLSPANRNDFAWLSDFYFLLENDRKIINERKLRVMEEYPGTGLIFAVTNNGEAMVRKAEVAAKLDPGAKIDFNGLNFLDMPEIFSTINYIQPQLFGKKPLTMQIGILFISVLVFSYFLIGKKRFERFLLPAIMLFWTPLYGIYLYNNFYDSSNNIKNIGSDIRSKRIIRYCELDFYHNMGGVACKLFSFVKMLESTVPKGASVKFIASDGFDPYLYYYLLSYYKYAGVDDSDYIIAYAASHLFMENNQIKTKGTLTEEQKNILELFSDKKLETMNIFDKNTFILKRKR